MPGIPFFEHLDLFVADRDAVLAGRDLVGQIAQNRVVFQKMSQGFWVGKVVDRNEFDIAVIERSPEHVSPDASESIDSYFNCHVTSKIVMTRQEAFQACDGRKMVTGKRRMRQIADGLIARTDNI